jgi:hypothetical protein
MNNMTIENGYEFSGSTSFLGNSHMLLFEKDNNILHYL